MKQKELQPREFKYKSAKLVWEARTAKKIAQYHIEWETGRSRTNISDWENGRRLPSRHIAWAVVDFLEIKWEVMESAWLEDRAQYEKEIEARRPQKKANR